MTSLSLRLKALRRQHELSLEQLAQKTGLTKSYLSKLERGLAEPSISTALKLADAYGLGVAQLVGDGKDGLNDAVSVVRVADRSAFVQAGDHRPYRYQSIGGTRVVRKMEPFVALPAREFSAIPTTSRHPGEELMLVLKGSIEVEVGDRVERLEIGDSIYFDSELPHRMRTVGRGQAEVLVVAAH